MFNARRKTVVQNMTFSENECFILSCDKRFICLCCVIDTA